MIEGKKIAKAVKLQFGNTKDGKPQVAINFEVLEGPDSGKYITWFGSFSEKAMEWTFKALAVCGAPRGKSLDELTVDDLGSLVELDVAYETWEGKPSLKVKWVNRPGGGGFTMKHELEGAELRALGARLKANFDQVDRYEPIPIPSPEERAQKSAEQGSNEPPPMTPGSDAKHAFAPGGAGDDIPF